MNYVIVSEEQRRANRRAVETRDRWRRCYAATSTAIRQVKVRVRDAHRAASFEQVRNELATLDALRTQADILMLFRQDIGITLRETAYRYAPREAVA